MNLEPKNFIIFYNMSFFIPKTKTLLILIFFLVLLALTRTFNLQKTARFIWDESSDLVHIHEIYVDKKITLVGPISEDGSKVFGSLTYYMLMPFAIAGHFDPISTAYGAAFWGILTGILIFYLSYKINKKFVYLMAPLILFWFPLVETGRWAWNPNFIPFWVTLSLIFFMQKGSFQKFLSGLFAGLAIHNHYLAVFSGIALGIWILFDSIRKKQFGGVIAYAIGFGLAIAPFVLFDLAHPPGLFLSRVLYFNNLGAKLSFFQNLISVFYGTFYYFTQSIYFEILLIASLLLLIYSDIKNKSGSLPYLLIFIFQLLGVSFVSNFYSHYILAGIPFFIIYIIYPRKTFGKIFSYLSILIILISLIISFPRQISLVTWESDIASTRFISDTVAGEIKADDLKNNNIAVLGSPDTNTYGRRYRDLLLIKGVDLKTKGEYEISDHLFLITQTPLDMVREDPAYEIKSFKSGKLIKSWDVPGSPWKMYLLNRY